MRRSIAELLDEFEADRNVGRDPRVGPSDYGTCARQVMYRVRGHVPGETVEKTRAATMGTLFWLGLGAYVQKVYGKAHAKVEHPVSVPGLDRDGSADLWWVIDGELVDVKTVSERAFDYVSARGAKPENVGQLETYALGINRAQGPDEVPISRLTLAYVNRDNGEVQEISWDYDEQTARRKVAELSMLEQQIDAGMDLPRAENARLGAFPCDWCPFWRECWDVDSTDLSTRSHESKFTVADEQIEDAIDTYFDAQRRESDAKRAKDAARAHLVGITYDTPAVTLKWSGNRVKIEDEIDTEALVLTAQLAGIEVPMRTVEKRTPWRISLKRKGETA